jgi:cobyrinic acid a,c-diamide synthase
MAGLSGGAGKTILTLGLCRSLVHNGLTVKPFKKGPDYIDAAWLGLAARRQASNLDPFLMPSARLLSLFTTECATAQFGLIEGNRGLYDGKDTSGSCSTAELAKLLKAPVILVLDCTKMTRTVAAVLLGCRHFDPHLNLAGVVLNRTAGQRHRTILRQCVETYTDVPVVGILPKILPDPIPERHMGLISDQEYAEAEKILDSLAQVSRDCLNLPRIMKIAAAAPPVQSPEITNHSDSQQSEQDSVRIGVIRDAALWFYYKENLNELKSHGAELVELSLLSSAAWPEIHGLYLGGGFPETQAAMLSENIVIRNLVHGLANNGLPIYAECGGFMYLGESLICNEKIFPMAGVFPLQTMLCAKPQGHGYTVAKVIKPNPFHPQGLEFTGHEFHYSKCVSPPSPEMSFALEMKRGCGIDARRDGLTHRNTFACYTHLHAYGVPSWAKNFVIAARQYKNSPKGAVRDITTENAEV